MNRTILAAGALLGATAVALGAFGAHALNDVLTPKTAGWWATAVQYQMWHALALIVIAALPLRRSALAAWCMGIGAVIFSGTLCLMALGLPHWLGAVTPIGGMLMIAGWLILAWSALAAGRGE